MPSVAKNTRHAALSIIVQIYGHLKRLVPRELDDGVSAGALKALKSMAATMEQEEHGAAAEIVPLALKATANRKTAEDAWQALLPLSYVSSVAILGSGCSPPFSVATSARELFLISGPSFKLAYWPFGQNLVGGRPSVVNP